MSDLGDELRDAIDGAATPVTFDEIVSRTAADRPRRAAWQTIVVAAVVVVALVAGAVVLANLGEGDDTSTPHIAAPTVVVGDIDLAVLSTAFDEDGARGPIAPEVVDAVRSVPGVAGAQGAMQRFIEVVRADQSEPPASVRSAIAISWEDGAPLSFSAGGPPQQSGEIAINASLAQLYGVGAGDELVLRAGPTTGDLVQEVTPSGDIVTRSSGPMGTTVRVVGVFTPAAGDVDGVNLAVMRAEDLGAATNRQSFDRIDIVATHDVSIDDLLDRVAVALPSSVMVVPPSVVGFDEQLRAELEIQRVYHALLNPDLASRRGAITGAPDDPESQAQAQRNWEQAGSQTENTELRVSRVAFLDTATAVVTYRAFYGGSPSPVVPNPLAGVAERVDGQWRLSQAGICELARASNLECNSGDKPSTSLYGTPPNGWNAVDSVPGAADAFRVVADPSSTVDQRVAVVDQGEQLRATIEAGAAADARRSEFMFNVSGARLLDATHAQILYSVIAEGDPHLETPFPFIGNATLVDGSWRVSNRFACGLTALATLKCPAAAALPTTTVPSTTTSTATSTTSTSTTSTSTTSTSTTSTTVAPTTTEP